MVVPVRLKGPEATTFSRLDRTQVRRRWFPKITVTVLEPVALTVDPEIERMDPRLVSAARSIARNRIVVTLPFERVEQDALHLPFVVKTEVNLHRQR